MSNDSSSHSKSTGDKLKSTGKSLYRYGVVFSAAMVVISLLNNLGSQIAYKLGINRHQETARAEVGSKQAYEKPSFNIFSSVVNEAKAASFVNQAT